MLGERACRANRARYCRLAVRAVQQFCGLITGEFLRRGHQLRKQFCDPFVLVGGDAKAVGVGGRETDTAVYEVWVANS